ncbi:hypothetical protein ONE63_011420 [Megalurothrips usitatus]|uniref:Uncharacterized protein n=1 Tax=Megalurothrips usitatus TaxID=439358 RepID=A0AAV7X010_9NEOP|nr:hypothetical protein ONE63_011420 [Megalurothrips usitatus]
MVMQNSLASEFNWSGRQKQLFQSQIFVKLVKIALDRFTKLEREKDYVKTAIQDWLRLSSQRFGGSNFKKWRGTKKVEILQSNSRAGINGQREAGGVFNGYRQADESSTAKGKQGEAKRSRESSTPLSTQQKPKPTRRRIVTEASDDGFNMDEHIAGSGHDDDVIIENAEEVSFEKNGAERDPHGRGKRLRNLAYIG